jgi:hypothetical protein
MVVQCIETRPPAYLVKDDHGEILEGTFYAEELQKVIFDRQVVNADYDNRVQDEYLTQKYDLRAWSLLSLL